MCKPGWAESMLADITGTQTADSKLNKRKRQSGIARLSYVDSVKLAQYRAWLASRVRKAERELPAKV